MGRLLIACLVVASAASATPYDGAQDRADVTGPIETWYRVLQGNRPVGYVHETLAPSRKLLYSYAYQIDSQFEIVLNGRPHAEDRLSTAFLDDTFFPIDLTSEAWANEASSSLSIFSDRDEHRIEARLPSADPVGWTIRAGDEPYALPTLMLYALRQNDQLAKPGRVTARVLDPSGKAPGGIEVVLEVRDPLRRPYLGKDVTATPVTFLKPPPAAVRETELREAVVDRYGRVLEATLVSGVRIVIARDGEEAMSGLGLLPRQGRRDPFDKATAMKNAALERMRAARGVPDIERPRVTRDSLMSDFSRIEKMIEDLRAQKVAGELDEARKTYLTALVHLEEVYKVALRDRPALLPQIDKAGDDLESLGGGAAQVENEARKLWVEAARHLENANCAGLEATRRELAKLRRRIEVERRPQQGRIGAWEIEIGTWLRRCHTRRELADAKLSVTAITLSEVITPEPVGLPAVFGASGTGPSVPFLRQVRMVEVNGRIYGQGDTIEGTKIKIERIRSHSLQVSLRDEVREVPLRK